MNPIAITKARARLAKAREAKERIKTSRDFDEFESAWTDFLLAANSIYTCLEQGSKDTAQSRQWFGGMKKGRRQDALLQYLHQARNADEHGLQPIAELRPGHIAIGKGGEPVHIRSTYHAQLIEDAEKLAH